MNGRDGTTAFLPLDSRLGGQGTDDRPTIGQFLIREQTRYIYRKLEMGNNKLWYNAAKTARRRHGHI